MQISILGLVLALAYLPLPLVLAVRVVARNSFGGIFTQEFPLVVVTLPASALGEFVLRRHKYCRLVLYLLAALLNATGLYFLGVGLTAMVRWMS